MYSARALTVVLLKQAGGLDSLTGAKAVQPVADSAFPANATGTYKGAWASKPVLH